MVGPAPAGTDPGVWRDVAIAAAIAVFFALTPPAIGAATVGKARRAGLGGLALAGAGLLLAGIALPYLEGLRGGPSRTAVGLMGAATWLPTLALARAGVLGATRAGGFDLATVYSRLGVLSSRRVALNRLGMLATIALCSWAAGAHFLDPGRALYLALAIGPAFLAPCLLLALSRRAHTGAATGALVVAATLFVLAGWARQGPDLLLEALLVGVTSLVAGAAIALFRPVRDDRSHRPITDPFVDIPLEGIE